MRGKIYKLFVVILILLNLTVSKAKADVAPPEPPPGSSIAPGEETTMVQMVSEKVVLELTGERAIFPIVRCYPGEADAEYCKLRGYDVTVFASFNMRNRSSNEERMIVRFPMQLSPYESDSIIQDFSVMVGNQQIDWLSQIIEDDKGIKREWAAFEITFPADQTKTIKVSYRTLAFSFEKSLDRRIGYFLETGAGWFGPIGQGEIILRMPYQATRYNILSFPESAEFSGREVIWGFENLEPTQDDNWQVDIIDPDLWQRVLDARKQLDRNPDDINALVELGIASIEASVELHGWIEPEKEELFFEGVEAYRSAIVLAPDDVDILVAYIQAIHTEIYSNDFDWVNTALPPRSEIMPLLQRLQDITGEEDLSSVSWEAQMVFYFYNPTLIPTMTITATNMPVINTPIPTQTKAIEITSLSPTLEEPEVGVPTEALLAISQQEAEPPFAGWLWLLGIGIVILLGGGIIWRTRLREDKSE